ncbi:hypothetical protein BRARA_F00248 [Brassica rapa]|uniref:Aminotransferase-like plant mobile domain-containing protein n=1 Tax=Brassica campestris TaxID=3711 RepID=A0A397Z104_BRACM|nr:hypothetical protein BRARA_F00248 [Brassica rapa]
MAPPSQNIPLPSLTSTDESKLDIKALSLSVSFHGWREANSPFKSWAIKMSSLHRPTWRKAGIFEAVMASTKGLNKDTDLLLGIAERWCPDTNTFLFPWGEATITLEDVMVLLGFSVLGSPYFTPLDSSGEEILRTLEEEWVKIRKGSSAHLVTKLQWMGRFMGTWGELEHAAFLGLWLSYFVFPTRYCHVDKSVLSIAIHLSRGTRIALAPPVLAHLYADLSLLKEHIRGFKTVMLNDKVELSALFKLVQVWTWERFRELRPNNTNPLRQGEPRLALWDEPIQKRAKRPVRMRTKRNVREILANSKMESFEWRPYTKAVRNWEFPKFYPEKAKSVPVGPDLDEEFISFARCIKVSELVGKDSVECYFPNRVASQFGLLQDVPCPVNQSNLFKEAAWDEYNKPIDGLRLFVPSRSALSYFTSVYCEWWRKGKRAVELAESLGDDDTSKPVPSGSKKSLKRVSKEDETQIDRYKRQVPPRNIRRGDDDASELVASGSKKSMKRVCKEDEKQVPSEKHEEDDGLSVGQAMRLRKKNTAVCSSDENHSLDPPPKVLPSREVGQKLRKEFSEKLKRSRYLSGGSASREVPTYELFNKEVVKRKSEHLGDKRAREDDDNITTAEMVIDREKGVRDGSESLGKRNSRRLERENNDSWIRQNIAYEDETVAQRKETGNKAGKSKVRSSGDGNNSSDPPLGANGRVVDIVVSRPETRQECEDEVGVKAEKEKAIVGGRSKEAKCLIHEDGENLRSNEKEEDGKSLKQTNLAIDEISLSLEARMMKVERTLAKIREWKTIEGNLDKNGITA